MQVSNQVTSRNNMITGGHACLLILLLLVSAATIIGYLAPYWLYTSQSIGYGITTEVGVGLVCTCAVVSYEGISKTECQTTPWEVFQGSDRVYFNAVRLLMIFSLILIVSSVLVNLAVCIMKRQLSLVAAILTILSGVLGVASFATFVRWTETLPDLSVRLEKGWAFYMSAVGSCFLLICGGISAYVSRRQPTYTTFHSPTSGVVNSGYVMQPHHNPTTGVVSNSGYVVQPHQNPTTGVVINSGYVMQPHHNPTTGVVSNPGYVVQPQEKVTNAHVI